MTASDSELLQQFARNRSDEAFAFLVKRHVNLVYSAALRQVHSSQLAEEVAQSVFVDLARNAGKLKADTLLTAWLYSVTRRTAIDVIRSESRRQLREQIAVELADMNSPDAQWKTIEPLLDEAMDSLDEANRTSVLLRYFENKSLREVGKTFGISDDAAQKRVSRAIEKIKEFFAKRGVAAGTRGLALVISANAVQAAPTALALTVCTATVTGIAVQATTTAVATKAITMTTLQKILVATIIVAAAGSGIYQTRQASALRAQLRAVQKQPLTESAARVEQLQRERDEAVSKAAELQQENERLYQAAADTPKMKGEIARLRTAQQQQAQAKAGIPDKNDPAMKSFLEARSKAEKITRYLQQAPEKTIPEMKLLTDVDWLSASKLDLGTDEDLRRTASIMRSAGKNHLPFVGALLAFTSENNGQLPSDISKLKPYLQSNLRDSHLGDEDLDAILGRYKLVHTGKVSDLPPDAWIVVEKAPVDKEYDSRAKFGLGKSIVIATGLNEAGDPNDKSY